MALKEGNKVPSFTGIDANGETFESEKYIGKQKVVIYFYPKNNTPGCTTQACAFRDAYQDFKDLGAEVIGISADTFQSHIRFQSKFNLPFILLSDQNNKIRKMFGVPNDFLGLLPGRATYVVDKNGIIQLVFDSTASKIHIQKALEILKKT